MRNNKKNTQWLLNFEGVALKVKKADEDEYVIYDQWDGICEILTLDGFLDFLDGKLEVVDEQGKRWNWAREHRDAKPTLKELFTFISNQNY